MTEQPQVTEQSPSSEWHHDLLSLKMFRKPKGGGRGHFWLAIIHVGDKKFFDNRWTRE